MVIAERKTLAQALLLLAYVLTCHFAVTLDSPGLQLLALCLLSGGILARGLFEKSVLSWLMIAAIAALAIAMSASGLLRYALYLPPLVLPLVLWAVFFRSLRPSRVPLVTAVAREVRGELSAELCAYTRGVTRMWSVFFFLLALAGAVLPVVAPASVWSLFTNFLSYLSIVLLFVGEFVYRQFRLRREQHQPFLSYLQSVRQVDVRQLL